MTQRGQQEIRFGASIVRRPGPDAEGGVVERDGERYYRIAGYDAMPSFLMSVVSGHDHWLFVSSTGGLTCGRSRPEQALFPYCTDDKLHDAAATTGPTTVLRVARDGRTMLWQPFDRGPLVYDVERTLYKNVPGTMLVFEEVNRDLGLAFEYAWTTGNRFGFVRRSRLRNTGDREARVELLDGLRNLMPAGVERGAQSELSTLVDGYKQAEAVDGASAALYTLSSILTDRAEPSEALEATVVWSSGLDRPSLLLSEDQLAPFRDGAEVRAEARARGKRGAFLVHSSVALPPGGERGWYVVADVAQGPSQVAATLDAVRRDADAEAIERDVAAGTARLERLAGAADAFQCSADELVAGRHFSNALCNVMRGGVFPYGYELPREDFLDFVERRNRPSRATVEAALAGHDGALTRDAALALAERSGDPAFIRLVLEYLPLTFSRRHGDPSRPWNHFAIAVEAADGSAALDYQGNWRDIFQNWEALGLSFPEYLESFVATFVNASTADGYNPYRISKDGIDWEVPEPDTPWSNIGYWGDHQVAYLLRLVELSRAYHPGRLGAWLERDAFVHADVPYRIKPYRELLRDPRDSVEYDDERARAIAARVAAIGGDGKLVAPADGAIHRVNLLEKLLLAAVVRLGNLVPAGGIWMNTQRPEWNDANNALVGYGLSMVTLCHLRRFLHTLGELLDESAAAGFELSSELAAYVAAVAAVLDDHAALLGGPVEPAGRKSFMDAMGAAGDEFRERVYRGLRGEKTAVARSTLQALVRRALEWCDHSIAHGRRADGLFHAYNLIRFDADGFDVEPLDEMLEGQVAALASGTLDGPGALALLDALRASALYRDDQSSYVLYPDRTLPSYLDKNVVAPALVERQAWIGRELDAGRTAYVERDVDGRVHFNGRFRNAGELRAALDADPAVAAADADALCEVWEAVFEHRRFTGRSGAMYKYEGLGCIYWHMVSKLLLATAETIEGAVDASAEPELIERLLARFREIREGIGVHKSPAEYGAFPADPYSHTPGFAGVQQPGLTGQVKEDVITRFRQLGVRVSGGEVAFDPVLLGRDELLSDPSPWRYTVGGAPRTETLPAGSLAFTLCGVLVVYRTAASPRIEVHGEGDAPVAIEGSRLGPELSAALFRRDGRIAKLVVHVPESSLR